MSSIEKKCPTCESLLVKSKNPHIIYCQNCNYNEKLAVLCPKCNIPTQFSQYCGADVCPTCENHVGLAKCFCGWNLITHEQLEDDVGIAVYNGSEWRVDY